jgi:D-alanyl-D-alanine carboxypeptidase
MRRSQNGWPVATRAQQDQILVFGAHFPNGVLRGDVATVLGWVASQYHRTVEPLVVGTCWGWYVKPIEGSSAISNHASGTAIDLNADQHPMGTPAYRNMSAKQIAACRKIVTRSGGVVRWGGDYSTRPDPMHWEIIGDAAAVRTLALQLIPPREIPTADFSVRVRLYREGDSDDSYPGYDGIRRIQRQIGISPDGDWGPVTTEALGYDAMTADRYRVLFALAVPPSSTSRGR